MTDNEKNQMQLPQYNVLVLYFNVHINVRYHFFQSLTMANILSAIASEATTSLLKLALPWHSRQGRAISFSMKGIDAVSLVIKIPLPASLRQLLSVSWPLMRAPSLAAQQRKLTSCHQTQGWTLLISHQLNLHYRAGFEKACHCETNTLLLAEQANSVS